MTTTAPPLTTRDSHTAEPAETTSPRLRTLVRGRVDDHRLVRPTLLTLLALTAVLYLWGLSSSGWANSFYAAAVQAGSESWKAFFFGSSDAANSITVDKTPLSLWPMALSARIFGMSSWSMLVPQALMGVGSAGLLYLSVRRATGNAWAGLGAAAIMALTPVAVLMFRFNNPDALLVLLLIGAVYATQRALDTPERAVRWLILGGSLVGFAFLAKMLQAFLVLPPLALAYAVCATVPWLTRLKHLLLAFGSMIAAAGWWILIVELWPADSRPYIGGSQNNSILELTLGYNGFGRLNGNEVGSVGGGGRGGNGGGMWGETGIGRMLSDDVGGQIGWLLPTALVLLVAGLWLAFGRGDVQRRSGLLLWGGWLVVTAATFSFMAGIFHAYYTVALAPAVGAVIAIVATQLWERREQMGAQLVAGFATAVTAAVGFTLLSRTPDFLPGLRWVVLVVGVVAALGLMLHQLLRARAARVALVATVLVTALAGPMTYSVATAAEPHTGSIPTASPVSMTGPGGGRMGGGMGGAGGLLNGSESTVELTAMLMDNAASYTWVAAAVGSNSASGYQLASGKPVMAIGGFNGSDPSPTLEQFQQYVEAGRIHYFIAGGGGLGGGPTGGRGPGGQQGSSSTSSEITSWVEDHFTAQTVDGVTVYDLSDGAA